MSDAPQSPDWFKASDGKWYPPPGAQPPQGQPQQPWAPPPEPKKKGGCLKTGGIVALVLVVLVIVLAVVAGDDDDDDAATGPGNGADNGEAAAEDPTDTRNLDLYPDRADRQDNDHEAQVGQSVRLAGYTTTVNSAEMDSDPFGGQTLVILVSVENRDDRAQPYNMFDWRIQTEGGQVLNPTISLRDDDLGSGDLVSGGSVTGSVAFDVGPGAYFVIYKPDPFSSHRGIWRIEVG